MQTNNNNFWNLIDFLRIVSIEEKYTAQRILLNQRRNHCLYHFLTPLPLPPYLNKPNQNFSPELKWEENSRLSREGTTRASIPWNREKEKKREERKKQRKKGNSLGAT